LVLVAAEDEKEPKYFSVGWFESFLDDYLLSSIKVSQN